MPNFPAPKIIRSHRRTISVHVMPDASIVVKAPWFATTGTINSFLQQHTEWIEEKLKLRQKHKPTVRTYKTGDTFLYLGSEVTLEIGNYPGIMVKGEKLLFPQGAAFRIKKELETWYIQQARKVISEQVAYYAAQMKAEYFDLTFSDTKSQWGRCTHDNRLQFSWRLIMAPLLTINYVVVHELAHTVEKNHGRSFWGKVRLFNPSYRQQIKWLKDHGNSLVL